MPRWTEEQLDAINKEGTNIIVSAGAGSGKTAVLTARVIRKLESGVNINELLVLTFTKAAAHEMKERIRASILKNNAIQNQLAYIDSSYITTFDSYALSIVKRYHYLLNISDDVSIIDSSIIYFEKKRIVEEIFEELYKTNNEKFLKLIGDLCIKDDKDIKEMILSVSSKLDLKYDKNSYLDGYIENDYHDNHINNIIRAYEELLFADIEKIRKTLDLLEEVVDNDYYTSMVEVLEPLISASTYDDIVSSLDLKLPILKRGSDEDTKRLKQQLSDSISALKKKISFDSSKNIKEAIVLTKDYVEIIIQIIKMIDQKIEGFKKTHSVFEFTDISKMAITVLKENKEVCLELKNSFNEIMIDEYQDTNDLQEEFISLIENNNVYMVGDIKQSIYRFRNANPYIFKDKYDMYSKNMNGYKIDLNKNFRSRMEVLENINLIFDDLMTGDFGGASYSKSHRMIFGNNIYRENGKTNQNQNMELCTYSYDKSLGYSKEEIEAFFIASDIKNKVENKYKIFDKDLNTLRDITYSDFVILMDRSTNFDLYKKIFEYLMIPLSKYTKTAITTEVDTSLLKNIIGLIIKVKNQCFDNEFKYYFTSIARSYLFRLSDQEIFNIIHNNTYNQSEIFANIDDMVNDIDVLTNREIILKIINNFKIYSKHITVGDLVNTTIRFDFLEDLLNSLSEIGNTIYETFSYLDTMIKDEYKLETISVDSNPNSVRIMTIHSSKGLEYSICYFPGLYSKFNIRELNEKILYNNKYGIITPYFKDGIGSTIYKDLAKNDYIIEEISEKVRLFYVALTRAREKFILIMPTNDEKKEAVDMDSSRSFLDFINRRYLDISQYSINIDIDSLGLTDKYNHIREYNYKESIVKTENKITKRELKIDNIEISNNKFSKVSKELYTKEEKELTKIGINMHRLLEMIDFKNPDLTLMSDDIKTKIVKFLNSGLDFERANIYKEYEFLYEDENFNTKHGIIDLVLEYDDHIKIIDYKLNYTDDIEYIEQLKGYRKYLETKTKKNISLYLYSIMNETLKEII